MNSSVNPLLAAALEYREKHGFSVIPVKPDKKPFIKWAEYQKRLSESEEIRSWWYRHPDAKIGIITGSLSNDCGIDIDKVEALSKIVDFVTGIQYPAATTPRGGYHYHFTPPNPCPENAQGAPEGIDFRGEGGYILAPPSPGYSWLPGRSINDVARPPLPDAYLSLLNAFKFKSTDSSTSTRGVGGDDIAFFSQGRRDADLFTIANALVKQKLPDSMVKQVLEKVALSCSPAFDLKEAREKVLSALKRVERRERNLSNEVREFVLSSSGVFLSSEVFSCLQLSSREDQKNLSKILGRLSEEGLIEKDVSRNGKFRRIDSEAPEIDFLNVTGDPLPIKYPFQIERLFKTMPKNIIVVAGEPDAGKTALLLNTGLMNMKKNKVYYFSSEMGALELRGRLEKTGLPLSEIKIIFRERAGNFADVIRPDDVNIIDFLEIHKDFYQVGGMLKDIHDRLKNGIAIVALQKNRGTDFGLGGGRGLEKPRLYLAMEPGVLKIIKAKNWVDPTKNPNGLQRGFKLFNGCEFSPTTEWRKSV